MIFIVLTAALFSLGLYGVLTRRELVPILACVEIMLGAASVLFVGLATRPTLTATTTVPGSAEAFGILLVVTAAAEAAVALAIVVAVARSMRSTDVDELTEVSG